MFLNFVSCSFLSKVLSCYRWISSIDGKPGFNKDALKFLEEKITGPTSWRYKHAVLIIDGMAIKKAIEYDQASKSYCGFIDLEGGVEDDLETRATEALVFMLSGLHGFWKVPFAYFLTRGISATIQTGLVLKAIEYVHEIGIHVVALTLDGYQTNMATIRKLGCSTDPDNIQTHFDHPSTGQPVFVFVDACHGLKLIRNQFCNIDKIKIPGVGVAEWSHVVNLNKFQKSEGLTAANKLSDRHIQFSQQKMKVRVFLAFFHPSCVSFSWSFFGFL